MIAADGSLATGMWPMAADPDCVDDKLLDVVRTMILFGCAETLGKEPPRNSPKLGVISPPSMVLLLVLLLSVGVLTVLVGGIIT